MAINETDKVNILGFGISKISIEEVIEQIGQYIAGGGHHYILASNVHTVMMSQHDSAYRGISNEADIALPDGKPLAWAAELLAKVKVHRICGRDLMRSLCKEGLRFGYSHYFLGGKETVLNILINKLKAEYPGINIAGYISPPFRPLTNEEDAMVIKMINDSKADIVWVGLGAPKQELWIGEHLGKIEAPVMAAVGAGFDFLSGHISQAPRWIQKAGLEWFFRLCVEPHRLWRRYIFNNPKFFYLLLCQTLGFRKYPVNYP